MIETYVYLAYCLSMTYIVCCWIYDCERACVTFPRFINRVFREEPAWRASVTTPDSRRLSAALLRQTDPSHVVNVVRCYPSTAVANRPEHRPTGQRRHSSSSSRSFHLPRRAGNEPEHRRFRQCEADVNVWRAGRRAHCVDGDHVDWRRTGTCNHVGRGTDRHEGHHRKHTAR